jgi:hypothetical protein
MTGCRRLWACCPGVSRRRYRDRAGDLLEEHVHHPFLSMWIRSWAIQLAVAGPLIMDGERSLCRSVLDLAADPDLAAQGFGTHVPN